MTEQLLQASNSEYRLIIAFARYGGLRCPSELVGLKWSDVDWDQSRFTVHSPKTEHHGKSKRIVPLFPELRTIIEQARANAADGVDRILPKVFEYSNLGTMVHKIVKRAGIPDDIPRFFQNCRSSRQTELEAEFPLHVVCSWLGNSESTAKKHYLKVQEKHFETASVSTSCSGVLQGVQNKKESSGTERTAAATSNEKTLKTVKSPALPLLSKYTREDSNLQPLVPKTSALSS